MYGNLWPEHQPFATPRATRCCRRPGQDRRAHVSARPCGHRALESGTLHFVALNIRPQSAAAAGLGKTTLAHVAARHCGYRALEINASDDRGAATLTRRVADAVEMASVLGARRPNCVIIDEIDGATGALVPT